LAAEGCRPIRSHTHSLIDSLTDCGALTRKCADGQGRCAFLNARTRSQLYFAGPGNRMAEAVPGTVHAACRLSAQCAHRERTGPWLPSAPACCPHSIPSDISSQFIDRAADLFSRDSIFISSCTLWTLLRPQYSVDVNSSLLSSRVRLSSSSFPLSSCRTATTATTQ
jgi:hypothetical protein